MSRHDRSYLRLHGFGAIPFPGFRVLPNPSIGLMTTATSSTSGGTRGRLSVMMFLEFFIWGAWYTTIAVYMTSQQMGTLTHWPFTVNPVAAIAAPFFVGLVADRFFDTQKVLGVLHLLGGLVLFAVPGLTGNPSAFILALLVYNLFYMPT